MTYKFQQIKPPKARGVLKESMWNDPLWVAERKYDGDRRIAQVCAAPGQGSAVRFTGTRESVDGTGFVEKSANLPHLDGMHISTNSAKLDGTVLDGEIVSPNTVKGGQSKAVTSIMGSAPERAIALQKATGWLRYVVFDCLYYKGKDIRGESFEIRRLSAAQAVTEWGNEHVEIVRGRVSYKREYFDKIIAEGGEGVILKHRDQRYGDDKLWVKVKGEWTADVVIMGFEPGKGKYKGQVGAIIFGQYESGRLRRCGTCSGFDDALRAKLGKRHLDKVLRIKHNGREMTGAFRHPRFDAFREDKNAKDCVFDLSEV